MDGADFWERVNFHGRTVDHMDTPCWEWDRPSSSGYGQVRMFGRTMTAPKAAYILEHGDFMFGTVCHKCDNRACVRPDHLYLGTPGTNAQDTVERGRGNRATKANGRWRDGRKPRRGNPTRLSGPIGRM